MRKKYDIIIFLKNRKRYCINIKTNQLKMHSFLKYDLKMLYAFHTKKASNFHGQVVPKSFRDN